MKTMSERTLNENAHLEFGKFCAIDRNQQYKYKNLSGKLARDSHTTYMCYLAEARKCKNPPQWKARMNYAGCTIEATMNVRTLPECGRILAPKVMSGVDEVPDAGRRSRSDWITTEVEEFMGDGTWA